MAIDPTLLETPAAEPAATPEPAAPAAAPAGASGEAATGAAEAPQTQPDIDWTRVFESPEYKSRKDKEIAAAQSRWQRQNEDRIAAEAAAAERARAAQAQMDRVRRAHIEGDLEAQAELSRDAYYQMVASSGQDAFRTQWVTEANAAAAKLADGDAELEARLNVRNFQTVQDWTLAMADARAEKRVQAEAETRAEALAEAKVASKRALDRNGQPNPDTAEMVGGHGGPVASLSIEELNARYAKAKDEGNSEEVARLKTVLHRRAPVMAGGRR